VSCGAEAAVAGVVAVAAIVAMVMVWLAARR
jgi:hypothetical protein